MSRLAHQAIALAVDFLAQTEYAMAHARTAGERRNGDDASIGAGQAERLYAAPWDQLRVALAGVPQVFLPPRPVPPPELLILDVGRSHTREPNNRVLEFLAGLFRDNDAPTITSITFNDAGLAYTRAAIQAVQRARA